MVSSHQDRNGRNAFGTRSWVERLFFLGIGFMISSALLYHKKLSKILVATTDAEQVDFVRRSGFSSTSTSSSTERGRARAKKLRDQAREKFMLEMEKHEGGENRRHEQEAQEKVRSHFAQEMEKYKAAVKQREQDLSKANIGTGQQQEQNWKPILERNYTKRWIKEETKEENKEKIKEEIKEEFKVGAEEETIRDKYGDPQIADPVENDDDRLNIVLFYADDWTMRVLGKLNPDVKTPNIDKMIDNGMLFANNCVTTSVCWISRASFLTGTYYSRHLTSIPWEENVFKTNNWNETLFPKLRKAGYYTGLMGKWHLPQPKDELNAAFDQRIFYYGKHWIKDFSPHGSDLYEHVTDVNRRHAIEFLQNRPKDKKFFLKVSFFATHAEDDTQPSYNPMNWTRLGLYPDDKTHSNYTTLVPPKTATERHWKELPHFFTDNNCGRLRWKNRWDPPSWQKNIRDIYSMATEVDWAVGEIIDELKKQKVEKNTLLIFTTDNGDLHGEHGLAEKWYPFEESIKVPLVIVDPRMPKSYHGNTNFEWTLNVDLAPTILGAAGLNPADFMQGRDIAEMYLSGEENQKAAPINKWHSNILRYDSEYATRPWRQEWFYEWNMGNPQNATGHQQDGFIDAAFALITHEWKYIYWPLKIYEQLYHRSKDPFDEYDILKNYYLHQIKIKKREWVEQGYRLWMETFTPFNQTPVGDSIDSTKEVYDALKKRFYELKTHVQSGGRI